MYRRAVASDPLNSSALGNLAHLLHFEREKHDEALLFYQRAIEADPSNSAALGNIGLLYHTNKKNYEEAERYYNRCCALGICLCHRCIVVLS